MNMQKILNVAVEDLVTIRVTCQKCAATAEYQLDPQPNGHSNRFTLASCPFCNADLSVISRGQPVGPLLAIVHALEILRGSALKIKVEFPITAANPY
jgi:hypothetical protein